MIRSVRCQVERNRSFGFSISKSQLFCFISGLFIQYTSAIHVGALCFIRFHYNENNYLHYLFAKGALRKALSLKWFMSWSRLSLVIPTYNFTYLHYSLASTRNISVFNAFSIFKELLIAFVLTWLIGHFVYLFFNAPIISILKTYFGSKRRRDIDFETETNGYKSKTN